MKDHTMTPDQIDTLRQLRIAGYAVCIFTPDEMIYSKPHHIEDAMIEAAWNQINFDTPANEPISA